MEVSKRRNSAATMRRRGEEIVLLTKSTNKSFNRGEIRSKAGKRVGGHL